MNVQIISVTSLGDTTLAVQFSQPINIDTPGSADGQAMTFYEVDPLTGAPKWTPGTWIAQIDANTLQYASTYADDTFSKFCLLGQPVGVSAANPFEVAAPQIMIAF